MKNIIKLKRKLVIMLKLACILAMLSNLISNATAVNGNTKSIHYFNSELDTTGAIQIKDPFGACHADSYDVMEELGVKINRKDITWAGIEPANNSWSWSGWDNRITALKSKNMTALPILDYSNPYVQVNHTSFNVIYSEEDVQEWLEYCDKCIERYYKNDSNYTYMWEIWNEPNLGTLNDPEHGFWTGTDEQFFELQKRTAAYLKAKYPGITLLSGGISGHDPDYLDRMFQYGAMENIDVLAFHPYSGSNYDTLDAKINDVKEVCRKYNFNGALYITEVGMSTQFDPNATNYEDEYRRSLELQATLVPKVYALSLANNIEVVIWYCLGDAWNYTWGEHNFGLVFWGGNQYKPTPYQNDTLKPSGYAYKALAHNINWSTYYPNGIKFKNDFLPSITGLKAFYFLNSTGDIILILWNSHDTINTKFSVPKGTNVSVIGAPSYKPNEAQNFKITEQTDKTTVDITIDFAPSIILIDLPNGTTPIPIVLENTMTPRDIALIIITPVFVGLCTVTFISMLIKSKKKEIKRA
ncbi:MAG: hypothetical protein ACTSRA_05380 [Promethearchaeota archaeon]